MTHAFDLGGIELGVATSATQIEGGNADTMWHRWAADPAAGALDWSTPAVASGHWDRLGEDSGLMAELGIRHYRLGLEWARIEPRPGVFDADAIAHYREELTGLRAAGITPLLTLHHFNDPVWFSDQGGFLSPDGGRAFLRYARHAVEQLGDLVDEWITINEPNVFAVSSYLWGIWPPAHTSLLDALRIQQNLARAHIHTYRLIHQRQPHAKVGFAQHLRVFDPLDPGNPFDRLAARAVEHLFQGAGTTASVTGRFPLPLVRPRGLQAGKYADFLGINYYTRSLVRGISDHTDEPVPVNDLGWEVTPEGFTQVLREYHRRFNLPIYVTENGTADAADAFRSRYLYEHLLAAADSGVPVERYYHWSLMDNWEWAEGETGRFGLIEVDFRTQERTVRASGRFFADIIANGGVTDEAYQRWVAPQQYPTNG